MSPKAWALVIILAIILVVVAAWYCYSQPGSNPHNGMEVFFLPAVHRWHPKTAYEYLNLGGKLNQDEDFLLKMVRRHDQVSYDLYIFDKDGVLHVDGGDVKLKSLTADDRFIFATGMLVVDYDEITRSMHFSFKPDIGRNLPIRPEISIEMSENRGHCILGDNGRVGELISYTSTGMTISEGNNTGFVYHGWSPIPLKGESIYYIYLDNKVGITAIFLNGSSEGHMTYQSSNGSRISSTASVVRNSEFLTLTSPQSEIHIDPNWKICPDIGRNLPIRADVRVGADIGVGAGKVTVHYDGKVMAGTCTFVEAS